MSAPRGLAITNPLTLYRSLVALKRIEPDPSQHRLAIELQKLYFRLKDYEPEVDYGHRLNQFSTVFGRSRDEHFESNRSRFLAREPKLDSSLALIKKFTNHESAIQLQSPKGLLVYGEVGSGKTMLVDLLAQSLPTKRKCRWHYSTFMIEIFSQLDQHRLKAVSDDEYAKEHSLLCLARDMILSTPILFLDEFQLPDRAASKILSTLLTAFFHLGGVLIATSNRMPEELAKAYGVDFRSTPSNLLTTKQRLLGPDGAIASTSQPYNERSDFATFLEVLRARCEVWNIEGGRDWRRIDIGNLGIDREASDAQLTQITPMPNTPTGAVTNLDRIDHGAGEDMRASRSTHLEHFASRVPQNYHVTTEIPSVDAEASWNSAILNIFHQSHIEKGSIPWQTKTIRVYGRDILSKTFEGVTISDFSTLCGTCLGPADYVSLASNFHTFIVDQVPVLTMLYKNEARRFISFLDALYEARCKLLIRSAAVNPDAIFFPNPRRPALHDTPHHSIKISEDETYPETLSEIYQDQTFPFRPNISSYTPTASSPTYGSSPLPQIFKSLSGSSSSHRSILADEDSDFGPLSNGSFPAFADLANEGLGDEGIRPNIKRADHLQSTTEGPNFQQVGSFIGEDERFACKRASSRLWEMCGKKWWERDESWWRPLPKERRTWEGSLRKQINEPTTLNNLKGSAVYSPGDVTGYGTSPYRTRRDEPPKLSWVHIWGLMSKWGAKAGPWGKGIHGLEERRRQPINDVPTASTRKSSHEKA